ncbi:hypothetical protein LCGC14_1712660 [marine sediment metagenome]|uniref:Uncharacterized protein n=1 Tax=marine sediment metagenome TaxID=412755 RepID=A0A0F9I258_9ZZZZ
MDCYDTIVFYCPDCGYEIPTQSKGGECLLQNFPHTAVPGDVASDCNRHTPVICQCGSKWVFDHPKTVCLTLRKVN